MSNYRIPDRCQPQFFNRLTYLGTSKSDLERDSGFSDASSEYLSAVELTDSEDAGRKETMVVQDPSSLQLALIGGSYSNLTPMIIMNNFVLKQPTQAPAEKQWSFPSSLDSMPQSQVVLLQPVVPDCSTISTTKTVPENARQQKVSAPKSYPRIAPHPSDGPVKRSGSSRMKGSSSASEHKRHHHHHHQQQQQQHYSQPRSLSPQPQVAPSQPADIFEVINSQTLQGTETQPGPQELMLDVESGPMCLDGYDDGGVSTDDDKLKRFSNTYYILNKCGLLDITMRTKQLIKENKRTQGQLQQLQAQTELLLLALESGDPQLWTKLQLSLQDAGKE